MPAYDGMLFDPPAPVARVTLRNPTSNVVVNDIIMLIDTGADVTVLPRKVVQELRITIDENSGYALSGFDGSRSTAAAAQLEMIFLSRVFKGQFLLVEQGWGVIGRNVLNQMSLLLDGGKLNWREAGT